MDTFDLLKKYNARKSNPLVADYNKDSADFAKGASAFYFMGDWTWSVIGTKDFPLSWKNPLLSKAAQG